MRKNQNLDRLVAGAHAAAITIRNPVTREFLAEVADAMLVVFESDPEAFWRWLLRQGTFPERLARELHPATDDWELLN